MTNEQEDYVQKLVKVEKKEHGVLKIEAIMRMPVWFRELVDDHHITSAINLSGDVEISLVIHPPLAQFYESKIEKILNLIWIDGLQPYCFRPFCCCDYDTSEYRTYSDAESIGEEDIDIYVEALADLDKYESGPVALEVFDNFEQYLFMEAIHMVADHLDQDFTRVFDANGYPHLRTDGNWDGLIAYQGRKYHQQYDEAEHKSVIVEFQED